MTVLNLFRIVIACSFFLTSLHSYSLKDLTLEEKVGQLLIVHFHGEDANDEAKTLIQDMHVGGFIYYNWANGLHSPEKVNNLSSNLQRLATKNRVPVPLIIAVDQEGGRVNRLTEGFTVFPSNKALAMTGNPELVEQSAFTIGQELFAVGINLDFAPVVDINNNPRNPVIGDRSFGDHADIVILYGKNALHGFHRAGIFTSLKHYPGHGDVEVDSHEDLPVVNKSLAQLKKTELLPFAKLADQTDTIMTAHIMVPAFDSQNCTTLSKPTLDYLRNEIGFKGVVISDSLIMEGLLKNCPSVDEAAIRAFNAGCDILLLGGKQMLDAHNSKELTIADVQRIHGSLVDAVRHGLISEDSLNLSVQRILDLKKRAVISNVQNPAAFSVSSQDAHKIAEKIWKNECGGTMDGLTSWNKGENFGSFGIGHFIWYPTGQEEKFHETFPELLQYFKLEGIAFPQWLSDTKKCPWNSREEFYQNFQSPQIVALRQCLYDTKDVQAIFIARRLEQVFPQMIENLSDKEKENVQIVFLQLANNSRGLYALMDYLNFKGSGTNKSETYKGQGWGLLQVLQRIPVSSKDVVADFVDAAKITLTERIQNSPPERNEQKWLNGWINRVSTYLE